MDHSLVGYNEHCSSINAPPIKPFCSSSSIGHLKAEPKIKYEELAISIQNSNQAVKRKTQFMLE
jgi:hypothetical protein